MSSTSTITLSSIYAVFRTLQDHLLTSLENLPDDAIPGLWEGLTKAYCKLSDYYFKTEASLYYIWAASTCIYIVSWRISFKSTISQPLVLDPQIELSTLLKDHEAERKAKGCEHILSCKSLLKAYFDDHYFKFPDSFEYPTPVSAFQPPLSLPLIASSISSTSCNKLFTPQGTFNFMACYRALQASNLQPEDELEHFFATNMTTCEKITKQDSLVWWRLHENEFPNVARLVRNILSIPCTSFFYNYY